MTTSLVSGLVTIVALAACGSVDGASPAGTATASDEACAVTGPLSSAFGVGPTVIFVTRGPGAQQACDAALRIHHSAPVSRDRATPVVTGRQRPGSTAFQPHGSHGKVAAVDLRGASLEADEHGCGC